MKINYKKIKKYEGFFHDGTILDIIHREDNIEIALSSAEINPSVIRIPVSKFHRIRGKLCIEGVTKIEIDGAIFNNTLVKQHDEAEIFDLSIESNRVVLIIQWIDYPLKKINNKISTIVIEGENIQWENIPTLEDPFLDTYLAKSKT